MNRNSRLVSRLLFSLVFTMFAAPALFFAGCGSNNAAAPALDADAGDRDVISATDDGSSGSLDGAIGSDAHVAQGDASADVPLCTRPDGGAGVEQMITGGSFACLRSNGQIRCWGDNTQGQLGDGVATHDACPAECSQHPVVVSGITDAIQISAGGNSACALRANGKVACWGINLQGQLGDGIATHSTCDDGYDCSRTPVEVANVSDAIGVAVGYQHACALKSDGTVMCWGGDDDGQLGRVGLGTDTCAVPGSEPPFSYPCARQPVEVPGISGGIAISAGYNHTCILQSNGSVWCWGYSEFGELGNGDLDITSDGGAQVSGLSDVTAIAAGYEHTCALHHDGTTSCWGWAMDGEIGDGPGAHTACNGADCAPTPLQVSNLSGVRSLAGFWTSTCATLGDGGAACWGGDLQGEIGDGPGSDSCNDGACRNTPAAVANVANVVAVSGGGHFSCFLEQNCTVACTGADDHSQLGDGTTTTVDAPVVSIDVE